MLVYDVGFCDGKDTQHYLNQGHRVVAVEANPQLADEGRRNFDKAISSGQLELVNVAVGETAGQHSFWVSSHPEYSSFDHGNAVKLGQTATAIEVEVVPLNSLFEKYGKPDYLKLDVEGADAICLSQLTEAPGFLSFEMGEEFEFSHLSRLGYSKFKLICQIGHFNVNRSQFFWNWIRFRERFSIEHPRMRKLFRMKRYVDGSSGPFGEETDGTWIDLPSLEKLWKSVLEGQAAVSGNWSEGRAVPWFDIHCAKAL